MTYFLSQITPSTHAPLFSVQLHFTENKSNQHFTSGLCQWLHRPYHSLGRCLQNTSAKYFLRAMFKEYIGQIFSLGRYLYRYIGRTTIKPPATH